MFEFLLDLGHPDRLVVGELLQQRQPVHAATGPGRLGRQPGPVGVLVAGDLEVPRGGDGEYSTLTRVSGCTENARMNYTYSGTGTQFAPDGR
ncbi:hypothetical protein FXW78_25765 [Rhodococcus opacus]|nr:hypothetical protein [Rhodococcus opacus]